MFLSSKISPRVVAAIGVSNLIICAVGDFMQKCLLFMLHYFRPLQLTLTYKKKTNPILFFFSLKIIHA